MASKEKEILDKVLTKTSTNDQISRMVEDQQETFPSASEISVSAPYVDPFGVPKWCDIKRFAYAWIDPKDDIQRHRAMDVGFFKIVTRSSSCIKGKYTERDFRDHGAVERQGMILVFRPKDLDEKLRTFPIVAHAEMTSTLKEGKKEDGFEITHSKFRGDFSEESGGNRGKMDVVAYEEAGTEGIKQVETT